MSSSTESKRPEAKQQGAKFTEPGPEPLVRTFAGDRDAIGNGPIELASFSRPRLICPDNLGGFYVTDGSGARHISRAPRNVTSALKASTVHGLAADAEGMLYVSLRGGVFTQALGSQTLNPLLRVSSQVEQTPLRQAGGLCMLPDKQLLVCDEASMRVWLVRGQHVCVFAGADAKSKARNIVSPLGCSLTCVGMQHREEPPCLAENVSLRGPYSLARSPRDGSVFIWDRQKGFVLRVRSCSEEYTRRLAALACLAALPAPLLSVITGYLDPRTQHLRAAWEALALVSALPASFRFVRRHCRGGVGVRGGSNGLRQPRAAVLHAGRRSHYSRRTR